MHSTSASITSLALCLAAGVPGAAIAGPLDPPKGPISSSFKTLAEVEPRIAINAVNTPGDDDSVFKITQPGSYYLTGNMVGEILKHGIEIAAENVTIDLMGFEMRGPGLDAITSTQIGARNIKVRNGTLYAWPEDGIDFASSFAYFSEISGIRVHTTNGAGIRAGSNAMVSDCAVFGSGGDGISADPGSIVTSCTVAQIGANGFSIGSYSTVTACTVTQCQGNGFNLVACSVTGCASANAGGNGFFDQTGSTIADCRAVSSTLNGFNGATGTTLRDCSASSSGQNGIYGAATGMKIIDCYARSNAASGIVAWTQSLVSGCTSESNSLHGFEVGNQCTISGNKSASNGLVQGAGVIVWGNFNRIEGNDCQGNDWGIYVGLGGNIVVRNTCSTNGLNWQITDNNTYGPIINRISNGSPGASGNSAPSAMGTTDANANFTY